MKEKRLYTKKRMVLFALFLSSSIFFASPSPTVLQSYFISIKSETITLGNLFKLIEKNFNYSFLIRNNNLDLDEVVSVSTENSSVEQILTKALRNQNATFEVKDKKIIVYKTLSSKENETHPLNVQPEKKKIQGTVIDGVTGEPVIGANIMIKGTTEGTMTDENGAFSIETSPNATLTISFIGYLPIDIKANKDNLNIKLLEDTQSLSEVIVVGYGTQKKANLTGSVATINASTLETRPVSSISAAIAGQMPGVTAIQTSGAPGSQNADITIRGKNSINAASPLVIVDGVPGSMNTIDPNDIENITVLKDAASSAIYGVQAANGVILITTKTGKKGERPSIDYSGSIAWASPTTLLNFLGSADYAMLYNEAIQNENPNAPLTFTEEDIELYRNGTDPIHHPNTDWYKETMKSSSSEQHHHIAIKGGTETGNYSAAIGYTQQNGLVEQNYFKRYNARTNVSSKINSWLDAGLNISGYRSIGNDGWDSYSSLRQYTNRISPTYSVYNEDGTFNFNGLNNPVAHEGRSGFKKTTEQQVNGILHATVTLIPKELTVKGVFSLKNDERNNDGFKKLLTYGEGSNTYNSGLREGYDKYYKWNKYVYQVLANYNKSLGNHHLGVLAGVEAEENNYKYTESERKGGGNDELTESLNTLDASSQKNNDGGNESARVAYFGRVQYDYAGRYLFEANIRRDASSRFAKENRWGTFPAFSAGWRISEENFIKNANANWLSNLKLRLGWGKTGNEETDENYPAIATYAYDSYMFNNSLYTSTYEKRYVNGNLKWATVTNYEAAIEASFLDNRIGFELAGYKKETDGMLLTLPVLGILGMDAPPQNAGKVQNTGFDLTLFHNNSINKDLSYSLNFNLSYLKNKITEMKGTEGADPDNNKYWFLEGYPIGSFYGYEAIGFFNTEEELANDAKRTGTEKLGDIKYADLNKDGKIDAANDRKVIGKNFPSWTTGFSGSVTYKDFDFYFLLQGAFDVDGYFENEAAYAFFNSGKVLKRHLDRWTPTNHDATYPRMTKDTQINYQTSSFWLQNTSYVRLKNISLGYNIPTLITGKVGIERAKLYVSGENLFTIDDLDGIDPEAPSSNRGAFYSNVKKISIGLKVSF